MAIVPTDIEIRLSIKTGSAGDSLAQGDPNESLGKYISTTTIVNSQSHNLFDSITGEQDAAGIIDYRCIFVANLNVTNTFISPVVWILSEVSGGATISVGVDPGPASALASSSAQAVEIANEEAAPVGVTFSEPTSKGAGIALGDLAPGECRAIWIRRTAQNNGPFSNDGVSIRVEGETEE